MSQAVGIRDFAAYHCGMNSASSLTALDEKPLAFCPECEQKVWWLCDIEPLDRYQRLVEFAAEQHLEPERHHWQQMLDAIRTPRDEPSVTSPRRHTPSGAAGCGGRAARRRPRDAPNWGGRSSRS